MEKGKQKSKRIIFSFDSAFLAYPLPFKFYRADTPFQKAVLEIMVIAGW